MIAAVQRNKISDDDPRQECLDQHTASIEKALNDSGHPWPRIVLSHLLVVLGSDQQKSQFLRRSSIKLHKEVASKLPDAAASGIKVDQHKEVHSSFIFHLDRENTFLDYIAKRISPGVRYRTPIILVFDFGVMGETSLLGKELDDRVGYSVSDTLCESVCPKASAERFVGDLYEHGKVLGTNWKSYFRMRRVVSECLLPKIDASVALGDEDGPCLEMRELSAWESRLAELAGIQSAISYMGTLSTYKENPRIFSVAVVLQTLKTTNWASPPVHIATMLSYSGLIHRDTLASIKKIVGNENAKLGRILDKHYTGSEVPLRLFEDFCAHGDLIFDLDFERNKNKLREFSKRLREIQKSDPFVDNTKMHSISCLMLLQKILGEVHEGKKLDFYFVCGERSLFSDRAILRKFSYQERQLFGELRVSINQPAEEVTKSIMRIAQFIAREHYPWFEEGRHALFWDCSSPDQRPLGLAKLKEGDWKQVVQARSYRSSPLSAPECVLFYSLATEHATGMLHLDPLVNTLAEAGAPDRLKQVSRAQTKLTTLLHWHRDRWNFTSNSTDLIEERLKDYLRKHFLPNSCEQWVEQLVQIVTRISSDDQKGGTVVVLDGRSEDAPFREMGKALNMQPIGYEADDLIDRLKLISHDGASVVRIREGALSDWQHRRYLFPGDAEQYALDALFTLLHPDPGNRRGKRRMGLSRDGSQVETFPIDAMNHPLKWKGTRRWAAAVAAFNKQVKLSIVISQDGEIQVWHRGPEAPDARRGQSAPMMIHVCEITKTGEFKGLHHEIDRRSRRNKALTTAIALGISNIERTSL